MKKIYSALRTALAAAMALTICSTAYAAFPKQGSFDGTYKLTAAEYSFNGGSYNNKDYAAVEAYFPAEKTFTIESTSQGVNIKGLFFINSQSLDNMAATYNQSTGKLTLSTSVLQPEYGIYVGISPKVDGEYVWGGITQDKMICMELQITESGEIVFPDFHIIAYSGSMVMGTVVNYGDITVTKTTAGGDDGGDDDDTIYGNPAIEGMWNVVLNDHYRGTESLKEFTSTYEVTLKGNYVTFMEIGERGTAGNYSFVGKFVDETTIQFNKYPITQAYYPMYQVPYVNSNNTNDMYQLNDEVFSAIYNPDNGTLTFPAGSGLKYAAFNPVTGNQQTEWEAAFDFVSAARTSDFLPAATISGSGTYFKIGGDYITVTYDLTVTRLDTSLIEYWEANVTEMFSDNETETDWTEEYTLPVSVANGKATITIPDLKKGFHDFLISISAYNSLDEILVTSNTKALSLPVGGSVAIRAPQTTLEKDAVTVSVNVTVDGIPAEAYYKMCFIDESTIERDPTDGSIINEGEKQYVDATVSGNSATATLSGLTDGTYNFLISLIAYIDDDEVFATSNNLTIRVTVSDGIAVIEADNNAPAVYYDLQGVRVENPANGLFIRVQGDKISKEVK